MAYQIFNLPKQVLHAGGSLKASWKVEFFVTGTSTPADVYTTSALSVAHSQPIQADSAGVLAVIYLDPEVVYKASVYDQNDVLQYTVDPINDSVLSAAIIGGLLYPRTAAEISAGVTPTNYFRIPGDVRRYGAVLDGSTDDSTALTSAISQQQQSGADVTGVAGTTCKVSAWVAVNIDATLRIRGNGMKIQCANGTRVAFVVPRANIDIQDVWFDGFWRVLSSPTGTTGTITSLIVKGCNFTGAAVGADNFATYIRIQNAVSNVWIDGNKFSGAKHSAIWIGDSSYANQDTWKNIVISDNQIDGVNVLANATYAFGILVYGKNVVIEGNDVQNIDCSASAAAGNGAYGIYTKARYARIIGNNVQLIGQAGSPENANEFRGINVKGPDRGSTADAQGYNSLVSANTVKTVGIAGTSGIGIGADRGDIIISANIVEDAGYKGILATHGSAAITDFRSITGNAVRCPASAESGIEVVPSSAGLNVISGNTVRGSIAGIKIRSVTEAGKNFTIANNSIDTGAPGSDVAIYLAGATYNLERFVITGNTCAGTNGVYLDLSGGAVFANGLVADNDLSNSTTKVGGTTTNVRVRSNLGYVTDNGGTSSAIATGANIAHGLAAAPVVALVSAKETGPTDIWVAVDATNIQVNFGGGGSKVFTWEGKTAAYFGQ